MISKCRTMGELGLFYRGVWFNLPSRELRDRYLNLLEKASETKKYEYSRHLVKELISGEYSHLPKKYQTHQNSESAVRRQTPITRTREFKPQHQRIKSSEVSSRQVSVQEMSAGDVDQKSVNAVSLDEERVPFEVPVDPEFSDPNMYVSE